MRTAKRLSGFTLVEVVVALAIAATGVLVLLAFLPGTADAIGDGHRTGRALACIELAFADVRAVNSEPNEEGEIVTPLMGIVLPQAGEEVVRTGVYFSEDGVPVADASDALFRVRLDLSRPDPSPDVLNIDCEARWPAAEGAARVGSVSVWGVRSL